MDSPIKKLIDEMADLRAKADETKDRAKAQKCKNDLAARQKDLDKILHEQDRISEEDQRFMEEYESGKVPAKKPKKVRRIK